MKSFVRHIISAVSAYILLGAAITLTAAMKSIGLHEFTVALGITGNLTLLDIAKLSGNDAVVGLVEENVKSAPEVGAFPMRTIKGTNYKAGVRTGLPNTGFRAANEGQAPSKSTFKQMLVEAFIFGGPVEVDKAVADAHEDGASAVQAMEASGVMLSSLQNLGRQIWDGITVDAKGFPGIKAALPFGGLTASGDALTINATGSAALTASSVYAVRYGEQNIQLIGGMSKAFDLPEWRIQQIVAAGGGKLDAYVNSLTGWIGLQMVHENAARRIANLTAENGKGLTDLLLADLLATFPVGMRPDAIFMSRRSCTQLQKSRTVVLQGIGGERPDQPTIAPRPTNYDGVPIIETDSILNNYAIEV